MTRLARRTRFSTAIAVGAGAVAMLFAGPAIAAEWEQRSAYYEDDGWLDISEWMDGNDYNPTDESTWRWDDETYELAEDTGNDRDNDTWYGYSARDNDDWFYDYYDPAYFSTFDKGGVYQYGARYLDYDNDGAYDAVATYSDWDGDGTYEDYDYLAFSSKPADPAGQTKTQERMKQQLPAESRQQAVTGQVERIKQVRVRGDRHTVVELRQQPAAGGQQGQAAGQPQGQTIIADLGRTTDVASLNLKQGDTITVNGPRSRVGEKSVILARTLQAQGKTKQIVRERRQLRGTVVSTHKANVRGTEHLMAIVDVSSTQPQQHTGQQPMDRQPGQAMNQQPGQQATTGQQAGQPAAAQKPAPAAGQQSTRVAVDLGPAAKLGMNITNGTQLTFTGVPVEVNGRRLLLAQTIMNEGDVVQIDRRGKRSDDRQARASQPAGIAGQGQAAGAQVPRHEHDPSGQEIEGAGQELQRKPPPQVDTGNQ